MASRAGVGRATLHRQFASRDELVRQLAVAALDATDAATAGLDAEPDARVALEAMFARLIPLAEPFHFLSRCPVDDPEVKRRYAGQVEDLGRLIGRLREQGGLDPAVPDAWAVALADSLIWTSWSAAADGGLSQAQAAALAARSFWRGVGSGDPDA